MNNICANRITPAHAGKRHGNIHRFRMCQDHPRTRGEKGYRGAGGRHRTGSPPHTRGKAIEIAAADYPAGITPAHAGKSFWHYSNNSRFRDHPRTRGEKVGTLKKEYGETGSPPHTRGKGPVHRPVYGGCRITPAHAGKRTAIPPVDTHPRDHPRTRGEKPPCIGLNPLPGGSPPHTRGKVLEGNS